MSSGLYWWSLPFWVILLIPAVAILIAAFWIWLDEYIITPRINDIFPEEPLKVVDSRKQPESEVK